MLLIIVMMNEKFILFSSFRNKFHLKLGSHFATYKHQVENIGMFSETLRLILIHFYFISDYAYFIIVKNETIQTSLNLAFPIQNN